jgi:hypothetical protein
MIYLGKNIGLDPSPVNQMQMWVRKSKAKQIRRRLSGNFGQRKWFGQTKRKIDFNSSLQFLAGPIQNKFISNTINQKTLYLSLNLALSNMNTNPVFDSVQELLSQGDTSQALQMLIVFLEKDGSKPEFVRTLRVVEANFNTTRQKEIKGILEFSKAQVVYAKCNDALLSVLEDLKAGRKISNDLTASTRTRNPNRTWLIGGGVLLVLGLVAGILITKLDTGLKCPDFRPGDFKIMILQFQNVSEQKRTPEASIQARIRELTKINQLATDVEIVNDKRFESNTPDLKDAVELGMQCDAEMVVWGQFEPMANDSISVTVYYAFTEAKWPPGEASQTFKNVSEIKTDRMKITNLDEAVFRICTALAAHENRMDLVKKWLNKIKEPNSREQEWKEIVNK